MKRLVLGLVLLLLVGAGVWVWKQANRPSWSTRDPEVLAMVEQAREELAKLYFREAAEVLERAAKKAPGSFAVHYYLSRAYRGLGREPQAREQVEILKGMDPATLTPWERMLLDLLLLRRSGDREAYLARLLEYQAAYPREAELTRLLAAAYQELGQLEQTEYWGRKTLELDANDALSYNILGYAELSRGRFAAAEEQFRKYAFIAEDQANPHDSLGELFLVTGRYEEAARELHRAIALNPRFYPAWRHLADLAVIQGELPEAQRAIAGLAEALELPPAEAAREQATAAGLLGFFHARKPLLEQAAGELGAPRDEWEYFVVHAAALARGDVAGAAAVEAQLEQALGAGSPSRGLARIKPLLAAHRALASRDFPQAQALAAEVAAKGSFANVGQAWTKLTALCWQAQALAALGRQEARQVLDQVRQVNPRFPLLSGGSP